MRIRISSLRRGPKIFSADQIAGFQNELRNSIMERVGEIAVGSSQIRVRNLAKEIDRRLSLEFQALFRAVVGVIDNSRSHTVKTLHKVRQEYYTTGFTASQLPGGKFTALGDSMPQGGLNWLDLSKAWAAEKLRTRPATANKFFIYTGRLRRQLLQPGYALSKFRQFGGSSVDYKGIKPLQKRLLQKGDANTVLAEMQVSFLSDIPSSLLPMLASRRWTDNSDGAFERRMIGGVTGDKLAGPDGRYRPLFQPLLQFWIAYRFPSVIAASVRKVMKDRSVGQI